jgi:hypothetical protein
MIGDAVNISASRADGQEAPEFTKERQKLVEELRTRCIRDRGLKVADLPGGKEQAFQVIKRDRLRATLKARRESLGPELRDALQAWWSHANWPVSPLVAPAPCCRP